ncbi:MAG: asparagine synthetase B [Candidatus Marinimicrobia bacterium]|nr:asparagine synthetase B [Candidatus Neomarinimicrobiota bacterium]
MLRPITLLLILSANLLWPQKLLIPMDQAQSDHLKAYGVTFWFLKQGRTVEWLLNYRGGSFLADATPALVRECQVRGVLMEPVDAASLGEILATIENSNMDVVLLEKAPRIAVYSPPNKQPWDDAVTLALEYAEVPYVTIYDEEVITGQLTRYDWLHLHHEDFTGQHGKFWGAYRNAQWYREQEVSYQALARKHGFPNVPAHKQAVALRIKEFVVRGGFLFAMCSATDSWDIALAAQQVDIVGVPYDGTPADPRAQAKLDFGQAVAFENYQLITDPAVYEYSTIDIPSSHNPGPRSADSDYFTLFEFAAKYDPVPTMLTQNHVGIIKGFMGQTTNFRRSTLKKSVVILGEREGTEEVRYIHGNVGQGTFTFLGGHDPEDYQHYVGDPPTNLALHPNSPGYRLILNNVLFPAARKKERKT